MCSCITLFVLFNFSPLAIVHPSWQLDLKNSDKIQFRSNPRNETYVLFHESEAEFANASQMCANFGSLVVVRDRNDQMFFDEWFDSQADIGQVWLGARFLANEVVWQTLVAPSSKFTNWAHREPYCHNVCCALLMNSNGKWATFPCHYKARVLCRLNPTLEKEMFSNSTQIPPSSEERSQSPLEPEVLLQWTNRMAQMELKVGRMHETISTLKTQLEQEREARVNETAIFNKMIQMMRQDFRSSMNALECQVINGGTNKC